MGQYRNGKTLKVIIEECSQPRIGSESFCKALVSMIAREIGMHPVSGPYSTSIEGLFGSMDDGVSTVLIIAESCIDCHTWPYYRAVRVVIDSCKDFDGNKVVSLLSSVLNSKQILVGVIDADEMSYWH